MPTSIDIPLPAVWAIIASLALSLGFVVKLLVQEREVKRGAVERRQLEKELTRVENEIAELQLGFDKDMAEMEKRVNLAISVSHKRINRLARMYQELINNLMPLTSSVKVLEERTETMKGSMERIDAQLSQFLKDWYHLNRPG